MIALPVHIRIFLYRLPTDMRKSFHGLVALTESALKQDPLSGSLFVFHGKHRAVLISYPSPEELSQALT